jgi:hypothetical protein
MLVAPPGGRRHPPTDGESLKPAETKRPLRKGAVAELTALGTVKLLLDATMGDPQPSPYTGPPARGRSRDLTGVGSRGLRGAPA